MNRGWGLNVLLHGESTFHQVHGGAATSHDGYFGASLLEFTEVTGEEYHRPSFPFITDLGERYGRMQAVGRFLGAEMERMAGAPSAPPPCVIVLGTHRKYRFPLVHFSSEGALQEDFIAPLSSFARSIGLSGRLDRFFDGGSSIRRNEARRGRSGPGSSSGDWFHGPERRLETALRQRRNARPEPALPSAAALRGGA